MLILLDQDSEPPACVPPINDATEFYAFILRDIARLNFYKASWAKYIEGRFYAELYATEAGWVWSMAEIQEATP